MSKTARVTNLLIAISFSLIVSSIGNYCIAQSKPNIVFIMSDDHGYQAISAYDKSLISTPNIDRIAKEGAIFKKAFVTNSLCGPSRAVLLTGKYSHINGFKDNRDKFDGAQETLPKILQKNGYSTAIVGKWHLVSQPQGFNYWNILHGQGEYYNPGFNKMGKDTVYNGYVTDITTDLALNWIDKNKEQPFFLMIHQKAPHRNQMPPIENLGLFNDRQFRTPPTFDDDYAGREALKRNKIRIADDLDFDLDSKVECDTCDKKRGKWAPRGYNREVSRLTTEQRQAWDKTYQQEFAKFTAIKNTEDLVRWQYQRFMEDYLRCIKSVDDNVGKVLSYLEENDLAENTIVIYTSDQGFFLGEHGLYDKRYMYEESFRTPMMIRYPNEIKKKQEIEQMVMNLDIAPTLLNYAGVAVPTEMQGASMKNLLSEKKVSNWRNKVYYHYYEDLYGVSPHYGVRTSRYKLIHFYGNMNTWELYDLKEDPREMQNLYNNPEYLKIQDELKKDLDDLRQKYKDQTPAAG